MKYASEQTPSKPMMLILNKADFLSERQRLVWAQYLSDVGIKFVFYSARREQQKYVAHHLLITEGSLTTAFRDCCCVQD